MAAPSQQKFLEIIKPHSNYEFIGNQKYWIGTSVFLVLITLIMLPLNAFVIKSRGHFLNWGVDFRGGTELVIQFSRPVDAGELRKTLAEIGHENADVVRYEDPSGKSKNDYMVRLGAVSGQLGEVAGDGRRPRRQPIGGVPGAPGGVLAPV